MGVSKKGFSPKMDGVPPIFGNTQILSQQVFGCLGLGIQEWLVEYNSITYTSKRYALPKTNSSHLPGSYPKRKLYAPQKLTWNLEMMVSNRNLLFQGPIFRFHVCFGGCN